MTRLVFTSCSDPLDAPRQPVWDAIAETQPDHLVLLGDQIYMDYSLLGVGTANPGNGHPARYGNLRFAQEMHRRYAAQWRIMKDSRLLQSATLQIHGIWDDHDFAWNNSFGDGGSNAEHGAGHHTDPVPRDKQAISRRLMRDFFQALASRTDQYPANPVTSDTQVPAEDLSVPMTFSSLGASPLIDLAPGVHLLLTDDRSFQTARGAASPTVFGAGQWGVIDKQLQAEHIIVLACGMTLTKGKEHLARFPDYGSLIRLAADRQARVLCLTGDIHDIAWVKHSPQVYEAVASGAARPCLGLEGAFGSLTIDSQTLTTRLVGDGKKPVVCKLDRASWAMVP